MESATHIDPDTSPKLAQRHARACYILPAVHAFLFLADWAFSSLADHGVAEGLTGPLIFICSAVLLVVDLPFSIVAFGVMFGGGQAETLAVAALGVGCTVWWYLLGRALDALIRRAR